jgi:hypothetical protein
MQLNQIITILASIGFTLAVITFIAGFRMVKKPEHQIEVTMHKINGYVTIAVYVVLAVLSLDYYGPRALSLLAWGAGLSVHLLKVLLARKGLAVRYGGYFGALLLITWLTVIFKHLPK